MEQIHHINLLFLALFSYLVRLARQFLTVNNSKLSIQNPPTIFSTRESTNTSNDLCFHEKDAQLVMESLGLSTISDKFICNDVLLNGAYDLLEEKESSLDELKDAFEVFDTNGDGLIGPDELRNLFMKLGLKERMELKDCEMMIRVHDKDGDEILNFPIKINEFDISFILKKNQNINAQ
ncbi:hypothetical protein LUZ60_004025 [Juncus effusus]|nr:hypothetical protein LUZ60_004025 [Juncus effusus]